MIKNYRVCLILPEGNPHSACFREIGLLLVSALQSNGMNCDFTLNQLANDRINIILGYHLMPFSESLKKICYIPYQLEQIHSKEFPFTTSMEQILRHATTVWDYSKTNIAFLKDLGIHAQRLIPGYHPNLDTIPQIPDANRNIDVLFYGSIGERRKILLDRLTSECKLKILFGVYGEKRDQWIRRSKMIINIHHYSQQLFEAVRISYLLNNRSLVISENSADYSYDSVNLCMKPYEELIDTCVKFLKHPEQMEQLRENNYNAFKTHYPMTELLKPLLQEL